MDVGSIGTSNSMERLSSGLQINRAADNSAGLSIATKMNSEVAAATQNIENVQDMNNLANTAEGALSSIHDDLSRVRELAVQASNGIYSADDKATIQGEIGQLLQNISQTATNTEFNQMKLLDGTFDGHVSMNTDGSGNNLTIQNSSLESLGLEGFDVTSSFNIEDIDNAISKVSESRSELGSASNAFEYAVNSISTKMSNIKASVSQIEDTDFAAEISNVKKNQILDQYKIFMQMEKGNQDKQKVGMYQDFKV